jgi:hypothetical protein
LTTQWASSACRKYLQHEMQIETHLTLSHLPIYVTGLSKVVGFWIHDEPEGVCSLSVPPIDNTSLGKEALQVIANMRERPLSLAYARIKAMHLFPYMHCAQTHGKYITCLRLCLFYTCKKILWTDHYMCGLIVIHSTYHAPGPFHPWSKWRTLAEPRLP